MIVAGFATQAALVAALQRLQAGGIGPLETYTPAPLETDPKASPLPRTILVAGLVGAASSFALQAYSSVSAYPLDIGGRPDLSWISFVPTIFENAVLLAVAAGVVGFLVVNRMPRLYEPIDEAAIMRRASSDLWCVAVHTQERTTLDRAASMLHEAGAEGIEEVPA